jgi:hypothetical protein
MTSILRSIFITASLVASTAVCSTDLPGQWTLSIENPEHHVVAILKVEFTDKKAPSCMGGEWRVLKVVSATSRDKDFFPTKEPLSYQIQNKQLTMGRNEMCDAYLHLQGPMDGTSVKGDYYSLGLGGSSPLGYFKLTQEK